MKYRTIYSLIAALVVASLFASLSLVSAQDKKPPSGAQQEKGDKQKNKKSGEEAAGQDDQVVKLGTQLVTVPFNVTDKQNRFINDLTKDDIEILEDNKPQEIQSFERQTDMALTMAMLIDVSGSQEYTLPEEVSAGKRFFQKILRPKKDLAAVISFEGEAELVQPLTSNIDKLDQALDSVRVPVMTAVIPGRTGTPPINGDSRAGSTAIYDAVYSVSSDLLRREAGRRVIILVTDGMDTSSRLKMKEAIERTWRNEIIVYSIGIGFQNINQGDLKKMASETGGRAFFPRNEADLDKAYAQIEEDLRSQNILTYQSSNDARDGSFRTIQVRVKTRKDLTVRHRRGYFAKKDGE
jgi:VWFA-related protein